MDKFATINYESMRNVLICVFSLCFALNLSAGTPINDLVDKYKEVKGASDMNVKGGAMVFARPVIRKYPIGPMADKVDEVTIVKMEKASDSDKKNFSSDIYNLRNTYIYSGKSETPNGPCDVYVHLASESEADMIIVYNGGKYILNVLRGHFPVSELQAIGKSSQAK